MRTGVYTLQQALTAEAASVLKHSLGLARRRGHAQVTPLHVAATLLSSSAAASNLLRRACLKSQPHHPASHPLHCRALELCFNVALNRLPTTPPPSSGPLLGSQPSLSNALIAALKRAQAHQRRGCVELQQQQLQQPPLLAVKVELEQLIISILDDPSVSRVMREAGFSSTCVKSNLEEESSSFLSPSPFLLESQRDFVKHGSGIWQSPWLNLPSPQSAPAPAQSKEDDLRAVLEVMLRKQGRTNAVVVGDSASMTEGIVTELMAKVERGEVAAAELKAAHFIQLHLSYVHLRLMSRGDVDLKVSDLRRKIESLASDGVDGGVIIYAGDLRWAVDEEPRDGCRFNPVEHMVAELGRLLLEFNSAASSKVWLIATARYQTYMRCQMRQPSLEIQWALQAVAVPSGGLALSLQVPLPSGLESKLTKLFEYPPRLLGSKAFSIKDDERLVCCAECTSNFEKEASDFRSEIKDTIYGSTRLPYWLQKHNHQKDALQELKKKWNSQCQDLHQTRHSLTHPCPPFLNQNQNQNSIGRSSSYSSSYPWWPCSKQSKNLLRSDSFAFSETPAEPDTGFPFKSGNGISDLLERDESKPRLSTIDLHCLKSPGDHDFGITLSLGNATLSDSATSKEKKEVIAGLQELAQKLQERMPSQSQIIPSIVDAMNDFRSCKNKSHRVLLIQGSDCIAKTRLTQVMLEHFGGSDDRLMHINTRTWESKSSSCREILEEALQKNAKLVVFVEDIDRADAGLMKSLIEALKLGAFGSSSGKELRLANTIFILTTSNAAASKDSDDSSSVIKMNPQDKEPSTKKPLKRDPEQTLLQDNPKKPRTRDCDLDLNLLAEEEEEEEQDGAVPSDLIRETARQSQHLPSELLELVTARITMDTDKERSATAFDGLTGKRHWVSSGVTSSGEGTGPLLQEEEEEEAAAAAAGAETSSKSAC